MEAVTITLDAIYTSGALIPDQMKAAFQAAMDKRIAEGWYPTRIIALDVLAQEAGKRCLPKPSNIRT